MRVAGSWTYGISRCRPRTGERGARVIGLNSIVGVPIDIPPLMAYAGHGKGNHHGQLDTGHWTHWAADGRGGVSFPPIRTNFADSAPLQLPISPNRPPTDTPSTDGSQPGQPSQKDVQNDSPPLLIFSFQFPIPKFSFKRLPPLPALRHHRLLGKDQQKMADSLVGQLAKERALPLRAIESRDKGSKYINIPNSVFPRLHLSRQPRSFQPP